jgi:hypothetical protein
MTGISSGIKTGAFSHFSRGCGSVEGMLLNTNDIKKHQVFPLNKLQVDNLFEVWPKNLGCN